MAEPASSPSTSAADGAKRRLAAADHMAEPAPGADGCGGADDFILPTSRSRDCCHALIRTA